MLIKWFLNICILLLVSYIVPGVQYANFWTLIVVSVVLGLVNSIIRPILMLLTLPVNILTFGLFTLVINGFAFWLVSTIVKGFEVRDFPTAFFAAAVYWIIIMIVNYFIDRESHPRVRQLKK